MKKSVYNRSEIMKQAWIMFRTSIYGYETFAQALRMAWYYAKREAERLAQIEARKAAMAAQIAERGAAKVETKRDANNLYNEINKSKPVIKDDIKDDVKEEKFRVVCIKDRELPTYLL